MIAFDDVCTLLVVASSVTGYGAIVWMARPPKEDPRVARWRGRQANGVAKPPGRVVKSPVK